MARPKAGGYAETRADLERQIRQIEAKLALAEKAELERMGALLKKSGLMDVHIEDSVLSARFSQIADDFRAAGGSGKAKPGGARQESPGKGQTAASGDSTSSPQT